MTNGWQSCGLGLLACISVNFRGLYNHLVVGTAGYSPRFGLWASTCVVCGCFFFPLWIFKGGEQRMGLARRVQLAPWAAPWGPQGQSREAVSLLVLRSPVQLCCSRSGRHGGALRGPASAGCPGCGSAGCLQPLSCCSPTDQTGEMEQCSELALSFAFFFFFFQAYNWLI